MKRLIRVWSLFTQPFFDSPLLYPLRPASKEIGAQAPAISPTLPKFSGTHGQSCDDSISPDHKHTMRERLPSRDPAKAPLLRSPFVNPRRSRRYATDFGLGSRPNAFTRIGTPFEDRLRALSAESSPSTTEEASDSDDLSSFYECAAADFPEPPPIGSPVIRRMRSSPWFGAQILSVNHRALSREYADSETPIPVESSCPPFLINRALATSQKAARIGPRASPTPKVNETTSLAVSFDLGAETSTLELIGEALLGLDMDLLNPTVLIDTSSTEARVTADGSDLLQWSISRRGHPFAREASHQPKLTLPQTQSTDDPCIVPDFPDHKRQRDSTLGRLPRIIRKVASMRSDTQRMDLSAPHTSGQRPIPKSRSFRSIPHSSETSQFFKKAHNGSDKSLFLFRGSREISTKNSHLPVSFLPDANPHPKKDQERVRRHHFSAPFTRTESSRPLMDPSFPGSSSAPTGLYRSYCNPSFRTRCSSKVTLPTSFVDIASDEDGRHESKRGGREKIRDFISKATGILRWGKSQRPKN
jgi:hypothetical protein